MEKQFYTSSGVRRSMTVTWKTATILIVFLGCGTLAHRCIFDEIQNERTAEKTFLSYKSAVDGRSKRDALEDPYQPIRVSSVVQDVEDIMDTVQVNRLKAIMGSATSVLSKLFSVYPVDGPLILQRSPSACQYLWNEGANVGKCGLISAAYREECLDNFAIPDDHLGGLWTWNDVSPEPAVTHFAVGAGIPDTDTVLYVKAEHTDRCDSGDVLAYAAFCKVDQYGRPIAGVINFCPDPLLSEGFDEEKYILLALHESFHVLGFSSTLFNTFQECRPCADGLECESRGTIVSTDSNDQPRIYSPAVSVAAQAHFGCNDEHMGAPLENLASTGSSSHWEMRSMFGSIMAPVVLQPRSTYLDNLTLALFEDSGWYRVNYEYADDYAWGKGQGCEFGLPELCATNYSQFFCNDSSSGCDHVGLNKATCLTHDYLDGCRVFWPDSEDQCAVMGSQEPTDHHINVTGELSGINSRCFLANILKEGLCTPDGLEGRCYHSRCLNSSDSYEIHVMDSDWLPCPEGTVIQVSGYDGEILCPAADVICRNGSSLLSLVDPPCLSCTTTDAPTVSHTSQHDLSPGDLSVSIEFTDLEYSEVDEGSEVNAFIEILIGSLVDVTLITQNRIEVSDIREGSVNVIINIRQETESAVSVQEAYTSLSSAVVSGQFCIEYKNTNYTASSVSIIATRTPPLSPSPASLTPDPTPAGDLGITSPPLTVIVPSLLAGLLALGIVLLYLWKKKKSNMAVAPAPTHGLSPREGAVPGEVYMVSRKDRKDTTRPGRKPPRRDKQFSS